MNKKTEEKKRSCRCCGIEFDPAICSQCQVAGCAANKKGDKCRLSMAALTAAKLSPHQLRARVVDLESRYAALLEESQRLARLVHHYESDAVKAHLGLDVTSPSGLSGKVSTSQVPA